jgi:hypothetical protein
MIYSDGVLLLTLTESKANQAIDQLYSGGETLIDFFF